MLISSCCGCGALVDVTRYTDAGSPAVVEARNNIGHAAIKAAAHPTEGDLVCLLTGPLSLEEPYRHVVLYDSSTDEVVWCTGFGPRIVLTDGTPSQATANATPVNIAWISSTKIFVLLHYTASWGVVSTGAAWSECVVLDAGTGAIVERSQRIDLTWTVTGPEANAAAPVLEFNSDHGGMAVEPSTGSVWCCFQRSSGGSLFPSTSGVLRWHPPASGTLWTFDWTYPIVEPPGLTTAAPWVVYHGGSFSSPAFDSEGFLWIACDLNYHSTVFESAPDATVSLVRIDPSILTSSDVGVSDAPATRPCDGESAWAVASYDTSAFGYDSAYILARVANDSLYVCSAVGNGAVGGTPNTVGADAIVFGTASDRGGPSAMRFTATESEPMLQLVWAVDFSSAPASYQDDNLRLRDGDDFIVPGYNGDPGYSRVTDGGSTTWQQSLAGGPGAVDADGRMIFFHSPRSGTQSETATQGMPACGLAESSCDPPSLSTAGILRFSGTVGGSAILVCLNRSWDEVGLGWQWQGQTLNPVDTVGTCSNKDIEIKVFCDGEDWIVEFTIESESHELPLEVDENGIGTVTGNLPHTVCGTLSVVGDVQECVDPEQPFAPCATFDDPIVCCDGVVFEAVGFLDSESECGTSCGGNTINGIAPDQTGPILCNGTTALETVSGYTDFDPDKRYFLFPLPFDDPGGLPGQFAGWKVLAYCGSGTVKAVILDADNCVALTVTVASFTDDPFELVLESALPAGMCCQDDIGTWRITIS